MKYAETITDLAQKFCVEGALTYDETYRRWREQDPDNLPWDGVNGELKSDALATGLNNGLNNVKKNKNHKVPFHTSSGNRVPGHKPTVSRHCYTFNNEGVCPDKACRYGHFCQVCRGNHPKKFCPLNPSPPVKKAKNTVTTTQIRQTGQQKPTTNTGKF